MAHLDKSITCLLIAIFALLLVTVLSAGASSNIYFAEVTAPGSRTHLRAGMWGACSLDFGVSSGGPHGCTDSQGAYSLTARLAVTSTQPLQSPQYTIVSLLGSHDTGPLVCFLVSFLLVIIAIGFWLYEVFSMKTRSLGIAKIITSGLLVLSCILSWIGFAFGVRLAPALEDGISEYNKRRDRTTAFQVSRGNAVWIGLVGALLTTLVCILMLLRWKSLMSDKEEQESEKSRDEEDLESQP